MFVDENIAFMRQWFDDVWNRGDFQIVRDRMAHHAIGQGQNEQQQPLTGPEEFIAFATRIRAAFPDIKLVVEDIFGVDDRVAIRWSARMTHLGDTLGMPATSMPVETNGITIVQITDGKITAGWDCWDQAGLMKQLASPGVSVAGATGS